MDHVVVFIDYQNAYRGARGEFFNHESDPHWRGQFSPLALGELLASRGTKPTEKGIDVQLAIDFATMAVRGEYEAGVLFSRDTDLKPPLEFVMSSSVEARCEVGSWRGSEPYASRLTTGKGLPFCHWITERDFVSIQDDHDYSRR